MAYRIKKDKKQKAKREELKKELEYVNSTKNIIFNVIGVLLVFLLFYIITTFITNNSVVLNEKQPEDIPAEIQYDEILAGETFNRPEEEYYVLFFDFDGENASYYNTISKTSNKKIYIVDLGNSFNKQYVSETTNKKVQSASDLKVKEATLIKINKKKNVSYFEGTLIEIKANIK